MGITFDADNSDVHLIENLAESQFFRHQQMAMIDGEIIAIKTITPVSRGFTSGGRWHITGSIRGLVDTDAANHATGAVIYLLTDNSIEVLDPRTFASVQGNVYAKGVPYSNTQRMDLASVDAAGPLTLTGRALAALPPDNFRCDGASFVWTYRVRNGYGSAAGEQLAGSPIAATKPIHKGYFKITIWNATHTTVVRVITSNADTGTVAYPQLLTDFGSSGQFIAELQNWTGSYGSRGRSITMTF